jgi:hypothetical protein
MTLDVTSFIDNKGGNAEEIRESQRKRGESVELVDQVIEMYSEWVKSTYLLSFYLVEYVIGLDVALLRLSMVLIFNCSGLRGKRSQQTGECCPERDRC